MTLFSMAWGKSMLTHPYSFPISGVMELSKAVFALKADHDVAKAKVCTSS